MLPRRGEGNDGRRRRTLPLAHERAPAHVAEAPPDHRGRLDVADEQALLEAGRPREDVARLVDHARVAVEDQLVLAADGVDEGDEAEVVAGADAQHLLPLALLAEVERRGREVGDELGPRERQVGGRRPGLPDVLAHRRADEHVAELEQQAVVPRREVAVLVEDAVVGQEALAVDRLHGAVVADDAGVVEVAVEPGRADEHRLRARRGGDLVERAPRRPDEAGPEQQVLGRVAGDGELGEEDEVGVDAAGLGEQLEDPVAVAGQVADDGVQLGECEAHGFRLSV